MQQAIAEAAAIEGRRAAVVGTESQPALGASVPPEPAPQRAEAADTEPA